MSNVITREGLKERLMPIVKQKAEENATVKDLQEALVPEMQLLLQDSDSWEDPDFDSFFDLWNNVMADIITELSLGKKQIKH